MVNLRTRLVVTFAALGMLCLAAATAGLYGMGSANARAERIQRELVLPSQYLKDGYWPLVIMVLQVYEANSINDPEASKDQFAVIEAMRGLADKQTKLLEHSKVPADIEDGLRQYQRTFAIALNGALGAAELSKHGQTAASAQYMRDHSRPAGIATGR